MKNLFALILSAIVFIACNDGYSVKGTIATEVLDGRNVYIKRNIDNTFVIIDSCKITHSTFELTGKADSSHMVALYIDDTPIIPFVAERGRMEIDIQEAGVTIKGTPLNDKLNSLMREQAELEKRMNRFERIETAMILEGSTAEAAQAYVSDSIDAIGAAMEMSHFPFLANRMTPASTYIHAVAPNPHTTIGIPKRNSQLRTGPLNRETNHSIAKAKTIASAPDQ